MPLPGGDNALIEFGRGHTDAWRAERHLERIGYYRLKDFGRRSEYPTQPCGPTARAGTPIFCGNGPVHSSAPVSMNEGPLKSIGD